MENLDKPGIDGNIFQITLDRDWFSYSDVLLLYGVNDCRFVSRGELQDIKNHAMIGDDVRSTDYLTNEEILKLIYGKSE